MVFTRNPLSNAIQKVVIGGTAMLLGSVATAQMAGVEEIKVTALAIDESADRVVAPFSILDADKILTRGGTLGDLLNGLPGIHSDSFGGGASRPVIRGQTSPRVKMLSDSSTIVDASDISPDHTVTTDPLLAQQIEVLRGPATLLYGGSAIGGVVNILDKKIPVAAPESGIEGFAAIRGNTVANEHAGAISLTGMATQSIAFHFESSLRDSDDYKAPNWDESRVDGTFSESVNGSAGASWVGNNGFLGLAYSYRDDEYGLPGHSHEYESCHPHGSTLHCAGHEAEEEHDHEHAHEEEAPIINLVNERVDVRGEYANPFAGVNNIRFRAGYTNYEHEEIEEDVAETTFANEGYEARVDVAHAPILGWQGIFGVQLSDTRFSAIGAEAFVPETDSTATGVFLVEHYQLADNWHMEAGLRYDRQSHKPIDDPRNRPSYRDSAFSYSGAAIWDLTDDVSVSATYARAQRLPHPQELYARGIHLATNTYECGLIPHPLTCGGIINNANLQKEIANNVEIGLRKHEGDLTYSFNLFRNHVDNYIYARTLDRVEAFRLIKYTQHDVKFTGFEAEVRYQFTDTFAATVFGDYVHADLKADGKLPRTSPQRVGARFETKILENVDTGLEYYRVSKQNRIADFETITPGYDMVNLDVNYTMGGDDKYLVFLRASNLLNEEVRNHTSFLANVIPMPGRNFSAGFKVNF
jgi:iron complex outermembrane receptor protein